MTTAAPAWTVHLCRSTPGAEDVAEISAARGAAVVWCGPDCCGDEEDDMSVNDDGTDLGEAPPLPATETRGGKNIDWDNAHPGEPLPEKERPPEKPPGWDNEDWWF